MVVCQLRWETVAREDDWISVGFRLEVSRVLITRSDLFLVEFTIVF